MSSALVILSGGQDSTTSLFWAKETFDDIHAITFNYGQRHAIEIKSARIVAKMANVLSHEIIFIGDLLESTSPLTCDSELEQYSNHDEMEKIIGSRIEKTFVPMRNTLFFTIAMNRAVALNCHNLVTGICQADNANYPDCTERFRNIFEDMANESLGFPRHGYKSGLQYQLHAPLMTYSKKDTVLFAKSLPGCWEALAYTHTSYDGKYPPIDMNHANVLRAKGFEDAGLPDPLVVRAVNEGLMLWPDAINYSAIKQEYLNKSYIKDKS
jgi:7-cyano-7-deazaguanine synthase